LYGEFIEPRFHRALEIFKMVCGEKGGETVAGVAGVQEFRSSGVQERRWRNRKIKALTIL